MIEVKAIDLLDLAAELISGCYSTLQITSELATDRSAVALNNNEFSAISHVMSAFRAVEKLLPTPIRLKQRDDLKDSISDYYLHLKRVGKDEDGESIYNIDALIPETAAIHSFIYSELSKAHDARRLYL